MVRMVIDAIAGAMIMLVIVPAYGQPYEPDSNTVALYHFDESSGSFVADASNRGNHGVAAGTKIVNGIFGKARYFNPWQEPVGGDLFGVSFGSATMGIAVGTDGTILRTSTGGGTWVRQKSGVTEWLTGVSFTGADTGFVSGNNGTILRTTDSGATWGMQASGTTASLWDISFTDARTGFAVGSDGTIVHTSNGGSSWLPQSSGTDLCLRGVWFTDRATGTVVGEHGTILRTTNGGTTWVKQSSGVDLWLRGIYHVGAETGTIVGEEGTILRTTDGGATWVKQSSGTTVCLTDVVMATSRRSTAVGWDGTILQTTDGGVTWLSRSSGTTRWLNSIALLGADTGFAVGYDGTILATEDGGMNWLSGVSRSEGEVRIPRPFGGNSLGFTVEAWVKVLALHGSNTIFRNRQDWYDVYLEVNPDRRVRANIQRPYSEPSFTLESRTRIDIDCWTHVAFTCDVGTVKLYVDGMLDTAGTGPMMHDWSQNYYCTSIGNNTVDGSGPWTFDGIIDEVRISNIPRAFVPLAIQEANPGIAERFFLHQNYPNPFNPTTVIRYQLPVVSDVKLVVYDMLGREVSVLVNERKNAGSYEVTFDALGLSSGVYFYRLQTGEFVQTRKLVLLQ